jgi:hypothetical protein
LICDDSPLVRLPTEITARQIVFFDGIRHAAEIADRSYTRLIVTLNNLAKQGGRNEINHRGTYTDAFLDAWAFVDSVDRFRSLLKLLPGAEVSEAPESFLWKTQDLRSLRNAADHIAQKADYYVAHRSAALGTLSWLTLLESETGKFASCAIVPGTIPAGTHVQMVNPDGATPTEGVDLVYLHVGEHHVSLSDIYHLVRAQVQALETLVRKSAADQGLSGQLHQNDLLVVVALSGGAER